MSVSPDQTIEEIARRAQILGCRVERPDAHDPLPPETGPDTAPGSVTLTGVHGERVMVHSPAGLDSASAEQLTALIAETHGELLRLRETEADTQLFTRQLDESFEAITLLYRLGEQAQGFLEASGFARSAVEGLAEVLSLPWCALILDQNRKLLPDELAGETILSTDDPADTAGLMLRLTAALGTLITDQHHGIVPTADTLLGPEVIIRPVSLPGGPVGWLLAGGERLYAEHSDTQASSFDTQTTEAVASLLGSVLESRRLYEEQQATFLGTLSALSSTLDAKDPYTRGHSERVALVARQLAERIGLDDAECERIHLAGMLHDIGKIGVPDRVLRKPGRLDDSEFELIKQHPVIGHRILEPIPAIADLLPAVLHHHERWDGKGYPAGLAGEQIPMHARILSLADTFDAMSSNRAYRSGRSREEVLAEFDRVRGVQFDPALVTPFLELDFSAFDEMKREHEAGAAGNQAADDTLGSAA